MWGLQGDLYHARLRSSQGALHLAVMVTHRTAGWLLFGLGTAVLGGTVVLGKLFMPELQGESPQTLEAIQGTAAMAKLAAFGSSFPLGLSLAIVGAGLLGGASGRRAALLGAAALALIGISRLVPRIFGTESSALYFGSGGVMLLILMLMTAHAWSQQRLLLPAAGRAAADLQALGYLCFGIATWYLCGTGGMPGFALDPERMAAVGSLWFAVANYKVALALFVLGWVFTWLGLRRAVRAAG